MPGRAAWVSDITATALSSTCLIRSASDAWRNSTPRVPPALLMRKYSNRCGAGILESIDHPLPLPAVAEIGDDDVDVGCSEGAELHPPLLQALTVPGHQDQPVSGPGEGAGEGVTDSGGRSGDEGCRHDGTVTEPVGRPMRGQPDADGTRPHRPRPRSVKL